MKKIVFIILTTLSLPTYSQDMNNYIHFNKLTEVLGTEYVIASIESYGKLLETKSRYFLFINTKTSDTNKVEFPNDAGIRQLEQIKIDSLGINVIVVTAKTVDLDGKNGINWIDPTQIIILSSDGTTKTQLTENKFFVHTWTVNKVTGTIVVTGYYDTNNNNRYDKSDKNEIHVYDLKTLKLKYKI